MSLTKQNNANIAFPAFGVDKITGVLVGEYNASSYNTVLGGYLYRYQIPHPFTRPVFCDALFSDDGVNYVPNGNVTQSTTMQLQVYSDSNYIYVLNTASVGTVYYKIVCTWIDNYDVTNPLITPIFQTNSSHAYFDSRQNYQKIYYNTPGVLVNGGSVLTVSQGLGSVPHFKLFFESLPGQVWPMINGGSSDTWLYDNVNQYECQGVMGRHQLTINFVSGSASSARVWPIIYYNS
jgi:hypothetical protein